MEYETVIGLEVHAELLTKTKLFCNTENRFGAEPNSLVCPVCLGLPGVLPVINEEAVRKHIMTALAFKCKIAKYSKFDRKNYFYPDMPKNFQTSQYDMPLASGGFVEIDDEAGNSKKIGLTRIHLEEDAGKSIHAGGMIHASDYTLLDYNRAGVPLLEIVSEPDMRSPEEAYKYLTCLKKILTWLGVSDCKMEEGSLRCDANISIRPAGNKEYGVKTEVKNLNSFKSVKAALLYEEKRQREILDSGGKVVQETRSWDESGNITISMRSKEEAHDYRYFPEPDLPPLKIDAGWVEELGKSLPEMPAVRASRFVKEYGIPEYDAGVLTSSISVSDFYESTVKSSGDPKAASNWIMGEVLKFINSNGIEINETGLTPESLGRMIALIKEEVISGKIGKDLVGEMLKNGGNPDEIIKKRGWIQISSEDELTPLINDAIDGNPKLLEQYLSGKESVREFFVGQVMKATRGKASPKAVGEILVRELEKRRRN